MTTTQLFLKDVNRSKKFVVCISAVPLLLSLANPVSFGADSSVDVPKISVDEVKQALDNPDMVIIDVRRTQNWWSSSKKIFSANRENPSGMSQWARKYAKDKTLVFYCA